jgi:hypothetical protein
VPASVLATPMSLDGYIAGPNDGPANPGGDRFMRLHEWYGFASDARPNAQASGIGKQFLAEGRATGAVLSGRNTVEQVDHWGGDTTMASRSSCPVTARRDCRSRSIH